jgi:transcriptional regulator with XRE-family HTH domain
MGWSGYTGGLRAITQRGGEALDAVLLMPIKDRLKQLRTAANLSQQALAIKAGLSVSAVVKLEAGGIPNPRVNTLQAIARALGVKVDDLLEEEEEPGPKAEEPPAPKRGRGRPRKGE